ARPPRRATPHSSVPAAPPLLRSAAASRLLGRACDANCTSAVLARHFRPLVGRAQRTHAALEHQPPDWRRMTEGEGKRVPAGIRLVFAIEFPGRQGDNCLLTRASRYVDLSFSPLIA